MNVASPAPPPRPPPPPTGTFPHDRNLCPRAATNNRTYRPLARFFSFRRRRAATTILPGALIAAAVFLNALALRGMEKNIVDFSRLPSGAEASEAKESTIDDGGNRRRSNPPAKIAHPELAAAPSNATFVGISSNAGRVSDSAIRFLVEAACLHGVKSYLLLGEKDPTKSLKKKILAVAQHRYLPLSYNLDNDASSLECANWIRVRTAPSHEELLEESRNRTSDDFVLELGARYPNNPLDPYNRIARIKRSREHQRRQLLRNRLSWGPRLWNWKEHAVIGVLDLDLFAYPSASNAVKTALRYIMPPTTGDDDHGKFHAICANGLQVSDGKRGYYDAFATILLPNTWLHRSSDRATTRGALEGEDAALASMTPGRALRWFVSEAVKGGGGGVVPVRSCFGGFALYRADVFFDPRCRYDSYNREDALYMSGAEMHACEHVVFNECLRRALSAGEGGGGDGGFRMAVKTDLTTLWHLLN